MGKKSKTVFVCQSCGQSYTKWIGRCSACGEWNSISEELPAPPNGAGGGSSGKGAFGAIHASAPRRLREVEGVELDRKGSGIQELDRVLGGGLVPGALILLGGDPGIGKSTLLLQASDLISRAGATVLYVTGEESPRQTRMRFDRLGASAETLWLVAETSVERIEAHVEEIKPQALIIDSIQTLYSEELQSAPGAVGQLRASTSRMMALAKGKEIVTFLVGHVTKDGAIAGPRVLEHMVDTVLYFEGQRGHPLRMLRAVKNRFGSTDEVGTFEMQSHGLREVLNPSELFLAERATETSGSVVSCSFEGSRPLLVEVQALVCPTVYGNPRRTTIGFDGNRVALLLAVLEKKAGLDVSGGDVFLNIAGGLRLNEPAIDLGVLIAIASSHIDRVIPPETLVFGEVGLSGEVRAVDGAPSRLAEAKQLGFERVLLPEANHRRLENPPEGLTLIPVRNVVDALDALF
ncbi:MAG: DNA repair protein RadA [Myxococcota bacterium]|nr:DNA repair protein RadA [Myxococcota bacterium]